MNALAKDSPPEPVPAAQRILEVERVTKRFGGLTALSEVSFAINRGEIGFLCAEIPDWSGP